MKESLSRQFLVREVFRLAYPSILSMVSITIQNFIDTAFISHVGKPQVAAVGLTSWYIWTLLSFFRGVASATNTFVARYHGSRRYRSIGVITWHMIFIGILFGIIYFVIGQFTRSLLRLINPPEEVVGYAYSYLKIRFYEGFFVVVLFVFEEFFRGIKKPNISLFVIGLISILNILLDYILIFGKMGFPALGVRGAAIATVASELIGFIIFLFLFLSSNMRLRYLTSRIPHFSLSLLRRIINVGLPIGLQGVLDVASFFVFGIIVAKMGVDALAINQIVIQILSLTFMPGLGFSKAATTLVSSYMGEGNLRKARKSTYLATLMALAVMLGIAVSFVAVPDFYISIFTEDEVMHLLGRKILLIAAIYEAFDAIGLVFAGGLFGAGDTKYVMWVILFSAWGLFIPATYLLGITIGLGIVGAWMAMALYIFVFGIFSLVRFLGKKWERIKI